MKRSKQNLPCSCAVGKPVLAPEYMMPYIMHNNDDISLFQECSSSSHLIRGKALQRQGWPLWPVINDSVCYVKVLWSVILSDRDHYTSVMSGRMFWCIIFIQNTECGVCCCSEKPPGDRFIINRCKLWAGTRKHLCLQWRSMSGDTSRACCQRETQLPCDIYPPPPPNPTEEEGQDLTGDDDASIIS